MPKKKIGIEAQIEISRRVKAGHSIADLAEEFSISERQVYRIIKKRKADTVAAITPNVTFAFRAPKAEVDAFNDLVEPLNFRSQSEAFRFLLLAANGILEIPPCELKDFNASCFLVNKTGTLLNQMARAANRGRLTMTGQQMDFLVLVLTETQALKRQMYALKSKAMARPGAFKRLIRERIND